jgi:DNA repair exonuclease SbcCD ATPase subunit
MDEYNNDLTLLVQCLATTFGDEVGQAVQDKINEVIALGEVDINALQAQITTLNTLLASNTEGDTLTAQSILSQLAALDSRLDVLESSTAVAQLQATVAALQASVAGSVTSLQDADAALQSNINAIQTALDALAQQVTTIQNSTGGGAECDCVALTAAIADQATAIANLQGVDAQQAAQIAALQTQVASLSVNAAAVAAAQAAADAAATAAANAAAAAAAAQATATAAGTAAATAQATADAAATAAAGAHTHINNIKLEIQNIDCVALGASFRTAMRGRLFGQAGGNGAGA